VERQRPEVDIEGLATSTFSADERRALSSLPVSERIEGFYRCWTRKESYIKARGQGLSMPLDRFTVSLGEGPEVSLQRSDPADETRWWILALPIDPGYSAALTVENGPCQVSLWLG